jgi:nitroreductase
MLHLSAERGISVEFSDVIKHRHSVRRFSEDAVDPAVLRSVLDAASLAPSALNEQPWRFYVATGATRARVGEIMAQSTVYLTDFIEVLGPDHYAEAQHWYTELGGAPVIIGVTIPDTGDEFMLLNRIMSVGTSVENLLLAAVNEGLGACSVTFSYWVRTDLESAFGVDPDRRIVSLIVLGWPDGPPAAPAHSRDIAVFRE